MKIVAGSIFVVAAAILYCCPYICSAIYTSWLNEYSSETIQQGFAWIGGHFTLFAIISLLLGVFYIIRGELEDLRNRKKSTNKIKDQAEAKI
ncbi:MAG: hypothetical protein II189_01470 [Lachnospiraceae bacterium]|nr:hypothetical protein [Lachnospiraceae bacterium]MBQ3974276.1 hypothetical protein [Lachnospiraceae bacterium]MBQ4305154.1 hypothetical protein [Lachnospiraceae bacterium]